MSDNANAIEKKQMRAEITDPDPFTIMDKMDDELILAEIEGRIVDTWVYHFFEGGKEQWGLSKVGVDAACSELAKKGEVIRELELNFYLDPVDKEYVVFVSKAGRFAVTRDGKEVLLDTAIGTKRQWTKLIRKDGSTCPNQFYFEQGAMKALRNARARLISEEIKTKIIAFAKEKNKTKSVATPEALPEDEKSKKKLATEKQLAFLSLLIKERIAPQEQEEFKNKLKQRFSVAHSRDLTSEEARQVIEELLHLQPL